MTPHGARRTPGRQAGALSADAWGEVTLLAVAGCAWLLVLLAQAGWFRVAPVAVLPLAVAFAAGALAWWRASAFSRAASATIVLAAALLYLPGAQQVALSGDAAIYPNEGAWLARTGSLASAHPALAALSQPAAAGPADSATADSATADLFFINSGEQFTWNQSVAAYSGLVYGGYYLANADEGVAAGTVQSSRMPQVIAWHGLANVLFGGSTLVFLVSGLFGIGALLLLYASGTLLYARWIALWAAALLGLCYPQIYLARASLAEMTGALWTLAGIWFALLWLRDRQARHLVFALLMWVTSWSARVDALLLLAPAALLIAVAAATRDRAALRWTAISVLPLAGLVALGTNRVYFLATMQLATSYMFLLTPALVALAVGAPLLAAVMWRWGAPLTAWWKGIERPALAALLLVIVAGLAWATVPGPWRDFAVTRPFQEIIWFSSLYIAPVFYWLAALGLAALFWRGLTATSFFLSGTLLVLAVAYLHGYTSANVYPISLRRLTSDLLPVMALVAGYALTIKPSAPWLRAGARTAVTGVVAVGALLWVALLGAPVIDQRENPHDLAFVASLHTTLQSAGASPVLLFEPQDDDSWIGWLAAPLFSLYGDWSLLLQSDTPEPAIYAAAVAQLEAAGRTVHVASQQTPLPAALVPPGMQGVEVASLTWESAMIGQARPPEEPLYWQFALPLHLYRLERIP